MQAFLHVAVDNFLTETGKVDYGKFRTKVKNIRVIWNNAHFKEVLHGGGGGEGQARMIYNILIDHLNHKLKSGYLSHIGDGSGREEAEEILEAA